MKPISKTICRLGGDRGQADTQGFSNVKVVYSVWFLLDSINSMSIGLFPAEVNNDTI
jgi:hypothetical protein